MRVRRNSAFRAIGFFCVIFAGAISAPVSAASVYMLPYSALVAASLQAGSRCVYMTYDKNGNRLSRSSLVIPATSAAWGSSVFGCSRWG
jgi:hypothetical protein